MSPFRFMILAAVLATSAPATADDLPFGGDALRHLASRASLVVKASQPRRLTAEAAGVAQPSRAAYSLYAVKVDEVLKGDAQTGVEIRVALPQGFDVTRTDQLGNSMLFLRPLSAEDLQNSNIAGQDVYLLVSGRYGAVEAATPDRKEAVQAYLSANRPEGIRSERVLSWTDQYMKSSDPFLQRSAVIDLHYERRNGRAIEQLGAAVRSENVLPAVKRTAIQALEASGSAAAANPLREVAENEKVQKALRESAVKAFQTIPGGEEQLNRWSTGGDQVLAPAAQSAIRNRQEKAR